MRKVFIYILNWFFTQLTDKVPPVSPKPTGKFSDLQNVHGFFDPLW